MLNIYTGLLKSGLSAVVKQAKKSITSIFTDPKDQQKVNEVFQQMDQASYLAYTQLETKFLEAQMQDREATKQEVIVQYESKSRAVRWNRPAFNYCFYVILLYNYILRPAIQKIDPMILPTELWTVFGVGFVGYAYLRSKDKGSVGKNSVQSNFIGGVMDIFKKDK